MPPRVTEPVTEDDILPGEAEETLKPGAEPQEPIYSGGGIFKRRLS
jgi:hypothetical protein